MKTAGERGGDTGTMAQPAAFRAALVALACAAAAALRLLPWRRVFPAEGGVRLEGVDAFGHLRQVEYLLRNFPSRLGVDPYQQFPAGQEPGFAGLFDQAVAAVALLFGGGEEAAKAALALAPVVCAALVPVPVYGIGRRLFGPWTGVAAAWLAALASGHYLLVSRIGFGDHHSAETLAWTATVAVLVRGLQAERRLPWALGSGLALGLYLGVWVAGGLFVAVLVAWALLECLWSWSRSREPDAAWLLLPVLGAAWLVTRLYLDHHFSALTTATLVGGAAAVGGLAALARVGVRRRWPVGTGVAALAVTAALAAGGLAAVAPDLFAFLRDEGLRRLRTDARFAGVIEMRPLFSPVAGGWSWLEPFRQLGFGLTLALPALAALGVKAWREERPELRLLVVWSGLTILLAFNQTRVVYYAVVNVALLAGWAATALAGRRPAHLLAIAALLAAPGLRDGLRQLEFPLGPSDDWRRTLAWLRAETPEPFGSPDAYYQTPSTDAPSAYGVVALWDAGHWITALGRRPAVSTPFQTGVEAGAELLLERDPAAARELARQRRYRYVILDPRELAPPLEYRTPDSGRLLSLPPWLERDPSELVVEAWRRLPGGGREPALVFLPAYYESLAVRLLLFGGRTQEPRGSTWLLKTEAAADGRLEIVYENRFDSYEAAERRRALERDPELFIGGLDAARTCVPLAAVDGFREVYASQPTGRAVKVFEAR